MDRNKEGQVNLWEQAGNKCLECALELLNKGTAMDMGTAMAVKDLIGAAISIDILNLRWAEQSRYSREFFGNQPLKQTASVDICKAENAITHRVLKTLKEQNT